jgi:hypothetical protein
MPSRVQGQHLPSHVIAEQQVFQKEKSANLWLKSYSLEQVMPV